jgi:hypothetical protein
MIRMTRMTIAHKNPLLTAEKPSFEHGTFMCTTSYFNASIIQESVADSSCGLPDRSFPLLSDWLPGKKYLRKASEKRIHTAICLNIFKQTQTSKRNSWNRTIIFKRFMFFSSSSFKYSSRIEEINFVSSRPSPHLLVDQLLLPLMATPHHP